MAIVRTPLSGHIAARFLPVPSRLSTPSRCIGSVLGLAAACLIASASTAVHAGLEEGRAKAQVCIACHGVDGNSQLPAIPSLAGQPRQFIVTALFMFREGRRVNEQMAPFVDRLSNADLNDLAQYFSAQKLATPLKAPDADTVAKGRVITEKNNCVACHTATLVGQQHIPRLAGQHKPYLLAQLKGFKAGTRADYDGTMTSAAQGLTADELEPLADYLATLRAP